VLQCCSAAVLPVLQGLGNLDSHVQTLVRPDVTDRQTIKNSGRVPSLKLTKALGVVFK